MNATLNPDIIARLADAFTTDDPGHALALWADTEPRPRVRLALLRTLIAIEEER